MHLLKYFDIQYALLVWETKERFFELMDKFFNDEIDYSDFVIEIEELRDAIEEVCQNLEKNLVILSPLEKAVDFCDLLDEIYDFCDSTDSDSFVFSETYPSDPTYKPSAKTRKTLKNLYDRAKNFVEINS